MGQWLTIPLILAGLGLIAWALRRPEVTGAIVGARRPDQVEGVFVAGDLRLSEADLALIEGPPHERTVGG
jgi:aryl-alcohol dehydrogenase-like predicted oxidoreductase